jgi:hypothetical protein
MLVMFGKVARIYPNFLLFPGVMICSPHYSSLLEAYMMVNTGHYQMTDVFRNMMYSLDWTMVCVNHVALLVTHGRNSSGWKCKKMR